MKGKIGTLNGRVILNGETTTGAPVHLEMTPDQAERIAHALLIQSYVARGNTPGEKQFRLARSWVLR